MSEPAEPSGKRPSSMLANELHKKVGPIELIGIGIYIPAFLALAVFAQQSPDHWFVKRFLSGSGFVITVLVLLGAVMAILTPLERLMNRRKAERHQDPSTK